MYENQEPISTENRSLRIPFPSNYKESAPPIWEQYPYTHPSMEGTLPKVERPKWQPSVSMQDKIDQWNREAADIFKKAAELDRNLRPAGAERSSRNHASVENILFDVDKMIAAEERRNQGDGFWNTAKQFGESLFNELADPGFLYLGTRELADSYEISNIVKKLGRNNNNVSSLSDTEQLQLRAALLRQSVTNELGGRNSVAQSVGEGLGGLIPDAVAFALSGGVANMATSGLKRGVANQALKYGGSELGKGLARYAPSAIQTGAKAAMMPVMQPSFYEDVMRRQTGELLYEESPDGEFRFAGQTSNLSLPKAIGKSYTASVINNSSEFAGHSISQLGSTLTSKVGGRIASKLSPSLQNSLSKLAPKELDEWVERVAKSTGFDGAISEFIEEQPATLLNAILVGDNQISDLLDTKQQLTTALTALATGSAVRMVNSDVRTLQDAELIHTRAHNKVLATFGDSNINPGETTFVMQLFDQASNIEELAYLLDFYWQDKQPISLTAKEALTEYAVEVARRKAFSVKGDKLEATLRNTSSTPKFSKIVVPPPSSAKEKIRKTYEIQIPESAIEFTQTGTGYSRQWLDMTERKMFASQLAKRFKIPNFVMYERQRDIKDPELLMLSRNNTLQLNGFYDNEKDRTGIILEHSTTERDIAITLLHEAVGHRGVRTMFDDQGEGFYDMVFQGMPRYYKNSVKDKDIEMQRAVADEYIARVAMGLVDNPTAWQKICWSFRNSLRNNLGLNLKLSNNDIRYILRDIQEQIERGETPPKSSH